MLGVKDKYRTHVGQFQNETRERIRLCVLPASVLCWVDSKLALAYAGGSQRHKQPMALAMIHTGHNWFMFLSICLCWWKDITSTSICWGMLAELSTSLTCIIIWNPYQTKVGKFLVFDKCLRHAKLALVNARSFSLYFTQRTMVQCETRILLNVYIFPGICSELVGRKS